MHCCVIIAMNSCPVVLAGIEWEAGGGDALTPDMAQAAFQVPEQQQLAQPLLQQAHPQLQQQSQQQEEPHVLTGVHEAMTSEHVNDQHSVLGVPKEVTAAAAAAASMHWARCECQSFLAVHHFSCSPHP